jgi:FKBP-type peptidyl-prolyl cis-trans isomerase SlyD
MKISINTVATVSYKIITDKNNSELIEFADKNNPRSMIFGNNSLMPGFEANMKGLVEGDNFEFKLSPEEAFGRYRSEMIIDVPKSSFEINGVIKEDLLYLGNEISMLDNGGNKVLGRVIEISSEVVKMDFNHKLADSSLFVTGTVHEVRLVTDEDLVETGECGSGCGCNSKQETQSSSCCSTNHDHEKVYEDDCPSCGNPAELRGVGHGNCGCS